MHVSGKVQADRSCRSMGWLRNISRWGQKACPCYRRQDPTCTQTQHIDGKDWTSQISRLLRIYQWLSTVRESPLMINGACSNLKATHKLISCPVRNPCIADNLWIPTFSHMPRSIISESSTAMHQYSVFISGTQDAKSCNPIIPQGVTMRKYNM